MCGDRRLHWSEVYVRLAWLKFMQAFQKNICDEVHPIITSARKPGTAHAQCDAVWVFHSVRDWKDKRKVEQSNIERYQTGPKGLTSNRTISTTQVTWLNDSSPDLNPTKHLWRDLRVAVHQQSPSKLRGFAEENPKIQKYKACGIIPKKTAVTASGASADWVKGLNTYDVFSTFWNTLWTHYSQSEAVYQSWWGLTTVALIFLLNTPQLHRLFSEILI